MSKRMKIMAIALAVFFGLIIGWNIFVHFMIKMAFSHGMPPSVISTTPAASGNWQPTLSALGRFKAVQGVTLAGNAANVVEKIYFPSGSIVKAGDLLITINDQIEQADLKSNEANLILAKNKYERIHALLKKGNISAQDNDDALAGFEKAQADVDRTKAVLAQKNVRAPFAGKIGIWSVEVGQYVTQGATLVNLEALDPMRIRFTLPEQYVPQLQAGQEVRVKVSAYPDILFEGKLNAIESKVAEDTHNILLEATVPNPKGLLYPGMFGQVDVLMSARNNVVYVPKTAIDYTLYGNSVFVVVQEGKDDKGNPKLIAKRRFVTTGMEKSDKVEIIKGLKAGEQVVTSGQLKLQNDSPVIINNKDSV